MMKNFRLTFADGFTMTVLATFDEMISMLDKYVQQHGDCSECLERIRYDRYIGMQYKKIW